MSLSDLSSIGSLVSGLAVLVSLVYLSLQVRQTERNQRALMNQGVANRISENIRWLTEPHINDLVVRVFAGDTQFTAQELNVLRLRLRSQLISTQDTYLQHKAGLADPMTFDNTLGVTTSHLAQPVFRAIWRSTRTTYAPEWMAYVDKLIDATPLATPLDDVARYKADLADVLQEFRH